MLGFVSCISPLTVGTEQGLIIELIRTEAHSYDVISGIADKNIPVVFNYQCHLVRKNKDIIKAEWYSVESGFSLTNFNVNGGTFLNFPIFSLECITTVIIVKDNRPS